MFDLLKSISFVNEPFVTLLAMTLSGIGGYMLPRRGAPKPPVS